MRLKQSSSHFNHSAHAVRRNRTIRGAVFASLFSKSGTLLLRLLSIPVAIRALGLEEFGVYIAITTIVAMLEALHIGIGPALTQGISRAEVNRDTELQSRLFSTAFLIAAGVTGLAILVFTGLISSLSVTTLFGKQFTGHEDSVNRALPIAIAIISTNILFTTCEKAREGFMETAHNNIWGAIGNFTGAITLLIGISYFPTIEFLLISVNGSVALAKVANAFSLFRARPWLLPSFLRFDQGSIRPLVADGGKFSVTYLLSALVEYNALIYFAGRLQGPAMAAIFGAMITIHFTAGGLLQMFTIPLWPALIDAHARKDYEWIKRSSQKLIQYSLGFAAMCGISLTLLGSHILPIWLGTDVSIKMPVFAAFSVYFFLHILRQGYQTLLLGIGETNTCLRVILIESPLVLVGILIGLTLSSPLIVYVGMIVPMVCVSAWAYPFSYHRRLTRLTKSVATDFGFHESVEGERNDLKRVISSSRLKTRRSEEDAMF